MAHCLWLIFLTPHPLLRLACCEYCLWRIAYGSSSSPLTPYCVLRPAYRRDTDDLQGPASPSHTAESDEPSSDSNGSDSTFVVKSRRLRRVYQFKAASASEAEDWVAQVGGARAGGSEGERNPCTQSPKR
jgi:hypothetical protein